MAEKTMFISQQQTKPIKILKWKVGEGNAVGLGRIILLYEFEKGSVGEQRKLKVNQAGTVHKILVQEGAIAKPGDVLCELKECSHPTVMNDMCAECGTDLRKNDVTITASVPMIHAIPDLKVSEELAQKLGKADNERLIKDRKLVLLVDLDQTLIHTTNDNVQPNIKDVFHFQLCGPNSPWYFTRLRPGTLNFLNKISSYFELHICTFGARDYAHMIAAFLDKDQKFFSNRILSRDECFDPTSKKANLKALFPCGDNMVCIIDDREDVWSYASNLIHVKPYHFFQHTGDINAPPGLDKHENDNKAGVDLSRIKEVINTVEESNETKEKEDKDPASKENNRNKQKEKIESVEEQSQDTTNTDIDQQQVERDENVKKNKIVDDENKGNQQEENTKAARTEEAQPITNNCSKKKELTPEDNNPDGREDKIKIVQKQKEENERLNHNGEAAKKDNTKDQLREQNKEKKNVAVAQIEPNREEATVIEVEDSDDYLFYLEEILKNIHSAFYEDYDKMEAGEVPDLKKVIPAVKARVLKDCRLVFSGLVPTHIKLEQSKAYKVAKSLGAEVTQDLEKNTTHLVAMRLGTAKVNAARKNKSLSIVTPDWLWSCAERWDIASTEDFALKTKGSKNRHPPPHCSSPEHVVNYPEHNTPASRKRTPSGRFMDTINPLMSFSRADIASMDKEVEDILVDASDSSDEESPQKQPRNDLVAKEELSSSSEDSLTGEFPKGYKRKRGIDNNLVSDINNSTEEDESLSIKFRRGELVDSELDLEPDSQESNGSVEAPDEVDDGEWNMMGAALEREFLSNN